VLNVISLISQFVNENEVAVIVFAEPKSKEFIIAWLVDEVPLIDNVPVTVKFIVGVKYTQFVIVKLFAFIRLPVP
jgi:hypothetical protein